MGEPVLDSGRVSRLPDHQTQTNTMTAAPETHNQPSAHVLVPTAGAALWAKNRTGILSSTRHPGPVSTFTEIRETVVGLSKPERAELAVLLLGSLDDTHYWVADAEVDNRSAEMDCGAVAGVTKEEFRRLCGR